MTTIITGLDAIRYATSTPGTVLRKHADPTDGPREVSIDEARAIAREDAGLIYADTRTITVAIDSEGRYASKELIWGIAEGDDTDAAVADAATWLAGGDAPTKRHHRNAEALDVVTIQWPAERPKPDGQDRRAIALALEALNTTR